MSIEQNVQHLAHARSGNIPGLFQARCCCGWLGEIIADESTATAEAGTHMRHERILDLVEAYAPSSKLELAGPGSETLDEYRRRVI